MTHTTKPPRRPTLDTEGAAAYTGFEPDFRQASHHRWRPNVHQDGCCSV